MNQGTAVFPSSYEIDMTIDDFINLHVGRWNPAPPASSIEIDGLKVCCGVSLPPDYLEFLRWSNGGDGFLDVQPNYLRIWPANLVGEYNRLYQMAEFVPGYLAFADAGGHEFFAFDTRESDSWSVYAIPFIPMDVRESLLVASNFSLLLAHLILPSEFPT